MRGVDPFSLFYLECLSVAEAVKSQSAEDIGERHVYVLDRLERLYDKGSEPFDSIAMLASPPRGFSEEAEDCLILVKSMVDLVTRYAACAGAIEWYVGTGMKGMKAAIIEVDKYIQAEPGKRKPPPETREDRTRKNFLLFHDTCCDMLFQIKKASRRKGKARASYETFLSKVDFLKDNDGDDMMDNVRGMLDAVAEFSTDCGTDEWFCDEAIPVLSGLLGKFPLRKPMIVRQGKGYRICEELDGVVYL